MCSTLLPLTSTAALRVLRAHNPLPPFSLSQEAWQLMTHHPSVGCMMVDKDDKIFTANLNFMVIRVTDKVNDGGWRAQSPIMSCPAIGKNGLVYVGADFRMYALKAAAPPAAQ
jgi:hypothetical protein